MRTGQSAARLSPTPRADDTLAAGERGARTPAQHHHTPRVTLSRLFAALLTPAMRASAAAACGRGVPPPLAPPLARLATVEYAREHGGALARVVQLRLLFDVIMRDCVAVAQNPRKRPDETLVEMFRALQRSGFEEACHSTRKR